MWHNDTEPHHGISMLTTAVCKHYLTLLFTQALLFNYEDQLISFCVHWVHLPFKVNITSGFRHKLPVLLYVYRNAIVGEMCYSR